MHSFLEFSKSEMPTSHPAGNGISRTDANIEAIDLISREMQNRKEQCRRLSPCIVRVTVGNEITDYHLPYQDREVLWAVDFNRMMPTAKYFGRFQNGRFTGLKYNYSYFFQDNQSLQYVESIVEYCEGRPKGTQIYFDAQGEVTCRIKFIEPIVQPMAQR
jgi:hypothetical protein